MAKGLTTAFFSIAIAFALYLPFCAARADAISDFYAGRTVTITIGSTPGGTYDLYARAIARHLGKYIAGSPKIIVQNMPGAGSYTAAAHVFNVAPQDGAAIGAIGAAIPFLPLIDPNSPKLEVARINWLPSPSTFQVVTLVGAGVPAYSIDDLRKRETVMATIAPGQLPSLLVAAANDALGTKIRGINGHPGLPEAIVALQRGEIDGYPAMPVDSLKRLYADLMASKKLRVLLQWGPAPSPEYPDAPYALDLAKSPADRALLNLAQAPLKGGYLYMLGPNVPKDRIAALRAAFTATFKDPSFLADAERQVLNVDPVPGELVRELLAQAYQSPPETIERMRGIYRKLFQ